MFSGMNPLIHLQVGAVPGYTTGHVEQPGAMQNTYNNYSTRTQTVYGPAAMTRSPVTIAAPTNYMAKTTSIAAGGPAMVSHNTPCFHHGNSVLRIDVDSC